MAASKKMKTKKANKSAPKKAPARRAAAKPARRPAPARAAAKAAPPKKAEARKPALRNGSPARPATSTPRPSATRTFADRVRDCERGTPVWFTVAGGIEHAALQGMGDDGTVAILTDAGGEELVRASNLFETPVEARAALRR